MIIAFVGRQGEGKTICMLYFAYLFRQIYKLTIKSNSVIKYSDPIQLTSFSQLSNVHDSILFLDEMHHDLDSRAMTKNIERATYFSQMRKHGNICLFNTQQLHKIDKRLREEINYIVVCRKIKRGVHKIMLMDYIDYEMGNYSNIKQSVINVSSLFGCYDTRQIMRRLS